VDAPGGGTFPYGEGSEGWHGYPNVIAQEFAKIFPNDVKGSGETLPDGSEILQVDTYPLTIYSAAAVQELHRENQLLRGKIAGLEERLHKIEEGLKDK